MQARKYSQRCKLGSPRPSADFRLSRRGTSTKLAQAQTESSGNFIQRPSENPCWFSYTTPTAPDVHGTKSFNGRSNLLPREASLHTTPANVRKIDDHLLPVQASGLTRHGAMKHRTLYLRFPAKTKCSISPHVLVIGTESTDAHDENDRCPR